MNLIIGLSRCKIDPIAKNVNVKLIEQTTGNLNDMFKAMLSRDENQIGIDRKCSRSMDKQKDVVSPKLSRF